MGDRVLFRHVREAGLCVSGARPWIEAQGWSWRDFVRNGRPVADFEATGDPLVIDIARIAREDVADG